MGDWRERKNSLTNKYRKELHMLQPQVFRDVRQYGYVRVATIVPKVTIGNPLANAKDIFDRLLVQTLSAAYVITPELSLTGYTCGDLFQSELLQRAAIEALAWLIEKTREWSMTISVGMPLLVQGALYNCAVTFSGGKILKVVPKRYPPNYREFYEARWFACGGEATINEILLLGQKVPFGTDILLEFANISNFIVFETICEDDWVAIPPSSLAALAGATVLANLSASNITIGKSKYRQMLMTSSSARNSAAHMYCAAGFGESTTDLAWDGQAMIAECGQILAENERFSLDGSVVIADICISKLLLERQQSSFHQNAADHRRPFRVVTCNMPYGAPEGNSMFFKSLRRAIDSHPFVPSNLADRDERCYETFNIQATSLARRLSSLHGGQCQVVLGLSGGQDSTHALLVAVRAMDMLERDRKDIIAITMPGLGTSKRTKANAIKLAKALGVTLRIIRISKLALQMYRAIGHDQAIENTTFENVQAWMRKQVELAVASMDRAIVLGTGDLSELALGWTTMFGDHASHYGVNAGVPKTLISFLINWTSDHIFSKEPGVQRVLQSILDTPISPELKRTQAGAIVQKTEEIVGPYELHDFFIYYHQRWGFAPIHIARLALAAFQGKYTIAEIKKWLRKFITLYFASQFKRSCLPDGPKVGLTAMSPRGDLRLPSDLNPTIWLQEVEQIPDSL
jgi:NAD+ synthase (glutamine-hydrolysing)